MALLLKRGWRLSLEYDEVDEFRLSLIDDLGQHRGYLTFAQLDELTPALLSEMDKDICSRWAGLTK